jgi:hypothetical protein
MFCNVVSRQPRGLHPKGLYDYKQYQERGVKGEGEEEEEGKGGRGLGSW